MSPSPNGRWTCTPRRMSSIETVPMSAANSRTARAGSALLVTRQWPRSSASRRPGMLGAAAASRRSVSTSMPGSGSSAAVTPQRAAASTTAATPARSQPGLAAVNARLAARRPRTRLPPRRGSAATSTARCEERDAARAALRVAASPGRLVLRRADRAGSARRFRSTQPRLRACSSRASARGARRNRRRTGRGDGVERERHAVIAGVGDQRDRVVEPVVGRAVGVVGIAQRHRTIASGRVLGCAITPSSSATASAVVCRSRIRTA